MINIDTTNRRILGTSHKVYVNGSLSNLLKCTQADKDKASFIIPTLRFDDSYKRYLQQKQVSVYQNGQWIFNGFLDTTNATCSPDEDGFTVDATSVTDKLNNIWVGQFQNRNVLTYRKVDGWLLEDILKDLFNHMGPFSNILELGNTSIIANKNYDYGAELILRNCTYAEAIDQILDYCGNVVYLPRYNSNGARLDLYQTAGNNNGTSFVRLAEYDDDAVYATIQSISVGDTSVDTVDQVSVWGVRQAIITVRGNANTGSFPVQLINDWDSSIEAAVRANPEIAKRDAPGYLQGAEFVDRRFKLPYCLHNITKLKDLPINKDAQGKQQYKLQAFQFKATLATDNAAILAYGVPNALPTLVDADFDLDNNYVIFKEPATNYNTIDLSDEKLPKQTFIPAQVGITIGIELDNDVLKFQTNTSKQYPKNLNILREDFKYVQYTNSNFNLEDGTEFGEVIIFTEDVSPPVINLVTEPVVIQDDSDKMQSLAYEVLKERNVRAKTLDITIPFVSNHYKVGNKLDINGVQNEFDDDEFSITSVSFDLVNYRTSLQADNAKPLKYSDV